MTHFIYKCRHGRVVMRCRCIKEHQVKITDCRSKQCIDDDFKARQRM